MSNQKATYYIDYDQINGAIRIWGKWQRADNMNHLSSQQFEKLHAWKGSPSPAIKKAMMFGRARQATELCSVIVKNQHDHVKTIYESIQKDLENLVKRMHAAHGGSQKRFKKLQNDKLITSHGYIIKPNNHRGCRAISIISKNGKEYKKEALTIEQEIIERVAAFHESGTKVRQIRREVDRAKEVILKHLEIINRETQRMKDGLLRVKSQSEQLRIKRNQEIILYLNNAQIPEEKKIKLARRYGLTLDTTNKNKPTRKEPEMAKKVVKKSSEKLSVKELLAQLEKVSDQIQKRKIRSKLRALGHAGGNRKKGGEKKKTTQKKTTKKKVVKKAKKKVAKDQDQGQGQ